MMRFVINEIREWFGALKLILTGKAGDRFKEIIREFETLNFWDELKKHGIWLWVILLAFFMGTLVSATYYNAKVNSYLFKASDLASDRCGVSISPSEIVNYVRHDSSLNVSSALPFIDILVEPPNKSDYS